MTLLFTGATSGFQVIWDRQFGFLKEIMVTLTTLAFRKAQAD